jgi:hypothetical protein
MMGKTGQELYREREKRVMDAIALKRPDRVPLFPCTNLMAVKYAGITPAQAFYDYDAWFEANAKMNIDLEPDIYWPAIAAYPGRSFDALQLRQLKWPGGGGAPDHSGIQYTDMEYMRPDEYDRFLDDPTDYFIRCYLPRVFGRLEPLKDLPYLPTLFYGGFRGAVTCASLASPDYVAAIEALYKAALESAEYLGKMTRYDSRMAALGLPSAFVGASCWAPFDVFADVHRGMRGVMMDLYRRPDKLLAAMKKITPAILHGAIANAKRSSVKRVFIPLHWGGDGFMSDDQYKNFYWPGLKEIIIGLIEEGLTPCPFFEGEYNSRLKYLAELPKGKILGWFDRVDMVKAKDMLKDVMCIAGNMPTTILQVGPAEAVREQTRRLIEIAGKDGGFIMASRSVLDEAEPRLVKVWAEATREYGVY